MISKTSCPKYDERIPVYDIELAIHDSHANYYKVLIFISRAQDNGIYLRIILGTVNVSLISKAAKYAYKNDYELFKLRVTSVGKGEKLSKFLDFDVRGISVLLSLVH